MIANNWKLVGSSQADKDVIRLNYNKYSTYQKQTRYNYWDASKQSLKGTKLEFTDNIQVQNEPSQHHDNPYHKIVMGEDFDNLDVTIKSIEEVIVEEMEEFGNISNISWAYQVNLITFLCSTTAL